MSTDALAFIDLAAQRRRLGKAIDEAMLRVVDHGGYIMGPEVKAFEADLAAFCGARHVVSCANGTDALQIAMMALDLQPGDEVITPSFTYVATTEVVALLRLKPVAVALDAMPTLVKACTSVPPGDVPTAHW